MGEETRRLLGAACGGDADDLAALVERIHPRVLLWASSHLTRSLATRIDPEDLAQRILYKVHAGFPSFRGTEESAFFRWVWQLGRNEMVDLHRYHQAERRAFDATEPASSSLRSKSSSPHTRAARRELLGVVQEVITELPEDMRVVFRLTKVEGLDAAEAGLRMGGRSANAVRILNCRTLARLRDLLAARGVKWDENGVV